jgi:DNA-binding CsgD family transcriptional regulator
MYFAIWNTAGQGGIRLFWFKQMRGKDDFPFIPVTLDESKESLQQRVEQLSGDEIQGYKWLREFYSEHWIAETLLLDKRQAKELIRQICRKLGVRNIKALLRIYGQLGRSKDVIVRTEEIDSYVDGRSEKEVQERLRQERAKLPERDKSPLNAGEDENEN